MPKTKRKALSARLRFEVFKRDGFACQYCGAHPPQAVLHVDHIIPVSTGGGDAMGNLTTACQGCNLGKSDVSLSAVPRTLAQQADEVREREAQLRGYAEVMEAAELRRKIDIYEASENYQIHFEDSLSSQERIGFGQFVDKLGRFEVANAAEIALDRLPDDRYRCFKYFCGICWKKLREASSGAHS